MRIIFCGLGKEPSATNLTKSCGKLRKSFSKTRIFKDSFLSRRSPHRLLPSNTLNTPTHVGEEDRRGQCSFLTPDALTLYTLNDSLSLCSDERERAISLGCAWKCCAAAPYSAAYAHNFLTFDLANFIFAAGGRHRPRHYLQLRRHLAAGALRDHR